MNTYIITYKHNGQEEDGYIYADSFEGARQKFQSICSSGIVDWELIEHIPVTDSDADLFIESLQKTKQVIRAIKKEE
jgi:hypothetical protein